MKIYEIDLNNIGEEYTDNNGNKWVVNHIGDLENIQTGVLTKEEHTLRELLNLTFEKVINWSRVPVDTKIFVKNRCHKQWTKRHFAKYENGRVYAWKDGRTSFTVRDNSEYTGWDCAKLYEESEE